MLGLFDFLKGNKNDKDKDKEKEQAASNQAAAQSDDQVSAEILKSPLSGSTINLEDVSDPAFASGALGKGVGIDPSEGIVVAPANGTISTMFPTGHAVGIVTDNGAEVLIHIGLDTVNLEGKGYDVKVSQDQTVHQGDILVEFDIAAIKEAGYSTITPVVVTNTDSYELIDVKASGNVSRGEDLIDLQ